MVSWSLMGEDAALAARHTLGTTLANRRHQCHRCHWLPLEMQLLQKNKLRCKWWSEHFHLHVPALHATNAASLAL